MICDWVAVCSFSGAENMRSKHIKAAEWFDREANLLLKTSNSCMSCFAIALNMEISNTSMSNNNWACSWRNRHTSSVSCSSPANASSSAFAHAICHFHMNFSRLSLHPQLWRHRISMDAHHFKIFKTSIIEFSHFTGYFANCFTTNLEHTKSWC